MVVTDWWDRFAVTVLSLALLGALLLFIGILGWQIYDWLRTGIWTELPFLVLFDLLNLNVSGVYQPGDWHGAAAIARWVLELPLSICAPLLLVISGGLVFRLIVSN